MAESTSSADVNYRGPVEMSGWVQKYQSHMPGRTVKRYFKLNNSVLSNHPKLTGPPTWELSVSKCIVKSDEKSRDITVKVPTTPAREVRFQVATAEQLTRWVDAIRSGSQCNIEDYYELKEELGSGAFGSVHLAFDKATKEKRAVKIVPRSSNAKELEFLDREVNVLLSISHKNTVRTFDIFDTRDKIYFVMEYISGGDFFDYMAKRKTLKEPQAKIVLAQLLEGIAYLHSCNIVHRDVKLENILIASENPLIVQLTDFGFANFVNPKSQDLMTSLVGTGCYMAPEVIDGRGHGMPVDVFATGVVMYRVLIGRLPFRGVTLQECYSLSTSGKIDFHCKEWREISSEANALCSAMLRADPAARPTAQAALNHPWFTNDEEFKQEQSRQQQVMTSKLNARHIVPGLKSKHHAGNSEYEECSEDSSPVSADGSSLGRVNS